MLTLRIAARSAWAALTLLLTALTGPVPQAQAREMTPLDIARLRAVTSVAVSPDGRSVAYTLAVPRRPFVAEDGPAFVELHVIGPDRQSRPFVAGPVNVSAVDWLPDGREISFVQKRGPDDQPALYAISVDGGEARRVLKHPSGIGAYAWSPDGTRIAFLAQEKEPQAVKDQRDKGFTAEVYEEDWRRTRVWIAQPQWTVDPWNDTPSPEAEALALPGSARDLRWSPDGQRLAVTLTPTPGIDDDLMRKVLHLVDVEQRQVVGRVETPGKLGEFRWSPDSRSLALIATTDVHDPQEGRLLLVDAEGGAPREVVPDYLGHFTQIEWLDNDRILALGQVNVSSELLTVTRNGDRQFLLEPGRHVIDAFSRARHADRLALLIESPTHPPDLFQASLESRTVERLTDVNPWLAEIDLSRQEVVPFLARDGLPLAGILVRPLHEEPGRKYPLILAVHGGPESHRSNGWVTRYSEPGQVAAARGFAVFYPNYRGSTGRGVSFSQLGQADYAGAEFNDLVDAVDHLVSLGLVDRDRAGVTGGSYGGFATAWCSTALTDRFAAGVMFVGIGDLLSKFGTTDIPYEMTAVHARKVPWDDWAWFLERSPIRHAEQGRTPLLILHGKDDPRVHPSQSLELYRYLKTLDRVPVRLVLYPGEGHGNRKAAARLDYLLRSLRWFEHYLQGPRGTPPPYALDLAPYQPEPDSAASEDRH